MSPSISLFYAKNGRLLRVVVSDTDIQNGTVPNVENCSNRCAEFSPNFYLLLILLLTAIGLSPGGSGYFTCKQNMKLVTTRFKSGGLHEKHVVATWNVGNHLSICL